MEKKGSSESEIPIAAGQSIRSGVYMCFEVMKTDKSPRWIIQALNLSHLSAPDPWSRVQGFLRQVLYTSPDLKLPSRPGCGVFGSKIVFGGGQYLPEARLCAPPIEVSKEIFEFETDASEPKIKRSENEFLSGKCQTMLMTLADGKLYALSSPQVQYVDHREEYMPAFEVFDATKKIWLPLPQPPFERLATKRLATKFWNFDLCYATFENTILLSTPNACMYRFDAANPAKGWTKHSETPLPCTLGSPLVLKHSDDNYIMFAYHTSLDSILGVYLMSSPGYALRHIASLVVLPPQLHLKLPPKFFPVDRYSIVHLGGRIVCLVLAKFIPSAHDCGFCPAYCMAGRNCYGYVKEKMSIFVVTFEYFLSPDSLTMDFNILDSHLLGFDTNEYGDLQSSSGYMLGAFFLGDPIQGGNDFTDHGVKSPKASKDINLNPGAKLSTSLCKRTTPFAVAATNVGCIPNHSSLVPIAAFQQNPAPSCSFGPDSILPYMNFQTGNGGSSSQCLQQYAGHYPVLSGPGYMYPNTPSTVGWLEIRAPKLFQVGLGCVYPNNQSMVGHLENEVSKLLHRGLEYVYPNYLDEEYDEYDSCDSYDLYDD